MYMNIRLQGLKALKRRLNTHLRNGNKILYVYTHTHTECIYECNLPIICTFLLTGQWQGYQHVSPVHQSSCVGISHLPTSYLLQYYKFIYLLHGT
jgi:hypothetical protein